MDIQDIVSRQRDYFKTGATIPVEFRCKKLRQLREAIQRHEADIVAALQADLGKSFQESYMCEIGLTLSELSYQLAHVRGWARPHRVCADLANFHSKYFTVAEPYGVTLVMSPWNYPFMLAMEPLIGAIAAGNCCVVKPSAYSPATSEAIAQVVKEVFDPGHVDVVLGGRAENTQLLEQRWDYIFFTGSVAVGRTVMEKASANLTPVTLELGGKSPCVVTKDANVRRAASRIAFGKFLNLGQTCVAPDYVLVDALVKDRFVAELRREVATMYGANAFENPNYGHMINQKHFDRVMGLIDSKKVVYGGKGNAETLQIEPTIMVDVNAEDPVMQEEIFGPVLPILTYTTIKEAQDFITSREKPLALYLFSNDRATQQRFLRYVPFGGGCINDTVVHLATSRMAFGGVGASGMGSYHGKHSFETFSHTKSILQKYNYLDLPFRNQPYKDWKLQAIKLFLG
ncbi:MAG: aldehyde dehydrogenase [Coriobacteriia bacterium]|nr:aldehyde dehydrogenase [Coriobacteriia bacterium]